MEYIIYLIFGLILMICGFLCYMSFGLYTLVKQLTEIHTSDKLPTYLPDENNIPPDVEEHLTEYEKYVIQRDAEYDERINKLKEDIALSQVFEKRAVGVPAEELHPDVKNLPHNTVKTKYDIYPIEVAE